MAADVAQHLKRLTKREAVTRVKALQVQFCTHATLRPTWIYSVFWAADANAPMSNSVCQAANTLWGVHGQALRELLQEQGDESVAGVLPQWAHVFPRLVLDNDRGVRQATAEFMHLLAQVPLTEKCEHLSFRDWGFSQCTALNHTASPDAILSFRSALGWRVLWDNNLQAWHAHDSSPGIMLSAAGKAEAGAVPARAAAVLVAGVLGHAL